MACNSIADTAPCASTKTVASVPMRAYTASATALRKARARRFPERSEIAGVQLNMGQLRNGLLLDRRSKDTFIAIRGAGMMTTPELEQLRALMARASKEASDRCFAADCEFGPDSVPQLIQEARDLRRGLDGLIRVIARMRTP